MATESERLAPANPSPRPPLKRSTVAALLVGVAVVAVASAILFQGTGAPSPQQQVSQSAPEGIQTGRPAQINDEIASASSAKAPAPPIPPHLRRDDDTAASGEIVRGAVAARNAAGHTGNRPEVDAEAQAQVRLAKALVFDVDEPVAAARPAGQAEARARPAVEGGGQVAMPTVPSDAIGIAQTQALAGLAAQQPQQGPSVRRDWLQDYADSASSVAGRRQVLRPAEGAGSLVLHQGKVIPAVLARGLHSDLPGVVVVTTAVHVYDSLGRGKLLIPRGSTVIGRYSNQVRDGQDRILVAFERLILADGRSFDLPAAQGSDLTGRAGVPGDVNNHYLRRFGASLMVAFLADRTQKPAASTNINTSGPQDAAGQILVDVGKSLLDQGRNLQPTITVPPGTRLNIEVTNDMVFPEGSL